MSESTGGVPPRPEDPDDRDRPADPWVPPSQPPSQPQSQRPAGDAGVPAYGQYAPPGYVPPVPAGAGLAGNGPGEPPLLGGRPSVGAAFSWAWGAFGRSAGAWLGATFVVLAIALAAYWLLTPSLRRVVGRLDDPGAVQRIMTEELTAVDTLLAALLSVVLTVLVAMLVNGALVATRTGRARFADLLTLRNPAGVVLLGAIQATLGILLAWLPLGALLDLVVSFFLVAAIFFVVDRGEDAITAIRSSVRLVSRNLGTALAAVVIAFALTLAGALAIGLGLLVTLPVSVLLGAHVYRQLGGEQPVPPA
jgi:uncharacterized membrane protein